MRSVTALIWAVRVGLWILPYRTVERLTTPRSSPSPDPGQVARAIDAAARRVPRATCLVRALVLRRLCGGEIRFGVLRTPGRITAHAWVEVCGVTFADLPGFVALT